MATTLWYRYHSYENWGLVLLETCIRLLSTVPVVPIATLLREVNERLTVGLDGHLAKLITNYSPLELITLFSGDSGYSITSLLENLISDKTISGSNVLRSVIIPTLSIILENFPNQIIATKNIYRLISSILGQNTSNDTLPATLMRLQRDSSRSATFFSRKTLPDVGRCITLILLQQEYWKESEETAILEMSASLLKELCACASFKKVVAQEPDSLAEAMLDKNCNAGIVESSRGCVLAGLLACLKNGSSG